MLTALVMLGIAGCSRTFDEDAFEYRQSQLGSEVRQIAQSRPVCENRLTADLMYRFYRERKR